MSPIAIRDVRAGDAADIARLCTQLGYPAEGSSIPARLEHLAQREDARAVVAIVDGAVVGLETMHYRYTLNHDAPVGQITMLVVDEAARGTGAGRALVDEAESWVKARGCDRIIVNTALHRSGAHAFYEKLGYTHGGRRYGKDFSHHG
ncbi:MAG: GNAT family N-acetyltransferase [Gemmatimonadaceae bacterium]